MKTHKHTCRCRLRHMHTHTQMHTCTQTRTDTSVLTSQPPSLLSLFLCINHEFTRAPLVPLQYQFQGLFSKLLLGTTLLGTGSHFPHRFNCVVLEFRIAIPTPEKIQSPHKRTIFFIGPFISKCHCFPVSPGPSSLPTGHPACGSFLIHKAPCYCLLSLVGSLSLLIINTYLHLTLKHHYGFESHTLEKGTQKTPPAHHPTCIGDQSPYFHLPVSPFAQMRRQEISVYPSFVA